MPGLRPLGRYAGRDPQRRTLVRGLVQRQRSPGRRRVRARPVDANGTIGAGAQLIDVYRGLARHGRTVPGGSCPTVGISGLTLGGGHGVTSRAYGLTCDNLISATLVTADGATLTTDADRHPDLFWALRGAGNGNFGVVTELGFRTRPAPPTVGGYLSFPWSRAQTVLATWQEWGPDQPDEIWSSAHLDAGPGGGEPTLSVIAFSPGTYGDLENAVDRLAGMAGVPAASVSLRRQSFLEAVLVHAGCSGLTAAQCHLPGTTPGRNKGGALQRDAYAAASDFFDRPLSATGLRALIDRAEAFTRIPVDQGGGEGSLALTALVGAVNRVDPQATAFVHRRSRVLAQYIGAWQPGTSGRAQQGWLKNTHAAMLRHASGAAYQNYVDPHLPDCRAAYYGTAAGRLARVKERYDPTRLFTFPSPADLRVLPPCQAARSFSPAPPPPDPGRGSGMPSALPRSSADAPSGLPERTRKPTRPDRDTAVTSGVNRAMASGARSRATAVPRANPPMTSVG